jgi:hypothetical protein
LRSKFEVKFNKKILDGVIGFRGGFMHTGRGGETEPWNQYLNVLGILERILLAMLGWKGNQYFDKLSNFSSKTLD